ncbi:hypothetical protein ASF34_01045 [Methylobacterium sp. Leaf106]|nr:hypothetical protein ASF34_01045 [Methylobacterium sp. Leaf106]
MQATAEKTADFYLSQGTLGATCVALALFIVVLLAVIRHLYKDIQKLHAERLAEQRAMITVIEGARDAHGDLKEALRGVEATLGARAQALSDLSHQVERTAQDARHGFANTSQMATGLVEMVRDLRDMLRGRSGGAP